MKVLIVNRQPLMRKGILQVLESQVEEKEYFEAGTIEDAVVKFERISFDIVIVDLDLQDGSGLDLIRRLKSVVKTTPKFILIASSISIFEFRWAKELEVDAYILKDNDVEDLKYAFSLVMKGEKYYPHKLVEKALKDREEDGLGRLTEREMDVFVELSKGLTNSQIGNNLYIAEGTAKKHISNILNKLNMTNRMEVLVYANKLSGKK